MYIDETYNRRVRIEGKPYDFNGYKLTIHDIDTGEQIDNVIGAAIYLSPGELNVVELTFHRFVDNKVVTDEDGNPVAWVRRINNPEIVVSAYEREVCQ